MSGCRVVRCQRIRVLTPDTRHPDTFCYSIACGPPFTTVLTTSTSTRVPAGLTRFAQRPTAAFAFATLATV